MSAGDGAAARALSAAILQAIAATNAPAVDEDRADGDGGQERDAGESERAGGRTSEKTERVVVAAGEKRRGDQERKRDDPDANQRAGGRGELRGEPGNMRLAGRDAAEKQAEKANQERERARRDEDHDEDRERAAEAGDDRGERRDDQTGDAGRVIVGALEQREREDCPEVQNGNLEKSPGHAEERVESAAGGGGADHLDVADGDAGDALGAGTHPSLQEQHQATDAAKREVREETDEYQERDGEDVAGDLRAATLGLQGCTDVPRDLGAVGVEGIGVGRDLVRFFQVDDRFVADEDALDAFARDDADVRLVLVLEHAGERARCRSGALFGPSRRRDR